MSTKQFKKSKLQKALLCCLSFSSASLIAVSGQAIAAEEVEKETIEVIEVKGIRGSLKASLNSKRFSDSVIDSISAEDIGDFPDKNIGDALQRVPGITVSRTYGEVDGVTIRGTQPEHSLLLLNGQNVASVGWFDLESFKRSFNFELVSAEQVAGLDVYKSVEAHNNEGAMGGTVDLKTRKPLDLDAMTVFASIESGYSGTAEKWKPGYSGLFSWKDDQSKFGILLAHSSKEQAQTRETLSTFGGAQVWNFPSWGGVVQDTDGNTPVSPLGFASIQFEEERERQSTQVTLQYAASDNLEFTANYHRFSLENPHTNTALFNFLFHNGIVESDSKIMSAQGVLVGGKVNHNNPEDGRIPTFNNTVVRTPEMTSDVFNLTMDYQEDDWSLKAVVGKSTAESRGMQSSTWWGDHTNPSTTGFSYNIQDVQEVVLDNPEAVNTHSAMSLYQEFTYLRNVRDHEISYYQTDFSYNLERGMLTTLELGAKYQEQEFSAWQENQHDGVLSRGMQAGLTMADFNGGHATGLHGQDGTANTLSAFALINDKILDYGEQNKSAISIGDQFFIDEQITAAYAKANFSTEFLRGNIGVRIVDTEVKSRGALATGESGKMDYSNILPSINVVSDITDNLLFRFAAGSTVSRPDYAQMRMSTTIAVHQKTADIGSPDILPYKSDQYDLGLEWYFDESSLASATFFQKNISDYIEKTVATESITGCSGCVVTRYRNAGTANVSGIELQYQQDFGNGFGIQANYTYTDSEMTKASGEKDDMYGVSQNSYNLAGYYENELYAVRVAYNARDKFKQLYNNVNGIADSFNQLDASVVWHAMENVDISFEAVNILNETRVIRIPESGYTHSTDEFGARYFVKASVKF